MKNLKIQLLLIFISLVGISQEKISPLKINEFGIGVGAKFELNERFDYQDFKTLSNNSSLLGQGDYFNYNGYYTANSTSYMHLTLQIRDKKSMTYRKNMALRLGVNYSGSIGNNYFAHDRQTERFDTLTSSQTGNQYYLDSVHSQSYFANHYHDLLSLDLSLIYRSNADARWSLYAGVGIRGGFSLYSETSVSRNESSTVDSYQNTSSQGYGYSYSYHSGERETIQSGAVMKGTFYTPIGVDFRIANKNEFFNKIHLFAEITPEFNYRRIEGLGSNFSMSFGNRFGLYFRMK